MLPGLWDGLEEKSQKGHYKRQWRVRKMKKHYKRYDVPLMNFRDITIKRHNFLCLLIYLLNKNNYLNIAKTKPRERRAAGCAKLGVSLLGWGDKPYGH